MLGEAVACRPRVAGDSPGTGLTAGSGPGQGHFQPSLPQDEGHSGAREGKKRVIFGGENNSE